MARCHPLAATSMCVLHIGDAPRSVSERRTDHQARTHELRALREENQTLYGVIRLVSSSLELSPMLQGVVDLATEATGCHACFIYLLEGDRLDDPRRFAGVRRRRRQRADGPRRRADRAGSPATGPRSSSATEAMADPRMKYIPQLQEERFQSMVAVPILARAGDTIGVIVLHTRAPHEFPRTP